MVQEEEQLAYMRMSDEEKAELRKAEALRAKLQREKDLQTLRDLEIPEEDESVSHIVSHILVDGIMFYQPMVYAPDIKYDPFDPYWLEWRGKKDATTGSAASSLISEEEMPKWLIQGDAIKVFKDVTASSGGREPAAPHLRDHQGPLARVLRGHGEEGALPTGPSVGCVCLLSCVRALARVVCVSRL